MVENSVLNRFLSKDLCADVRIPKPKVTGSNPVGRTLRI